MTKLRPQSDIVLITGATGFIGHYVLAALLRQGQRCVAMLRGPINDSRARLVRVLTGAGVDAESAIRARALDVVEGELPQRLPQWPAALPLPGAIVHIAASIRFDADGSGEPYRTNVEGTQRITQWATEHGVRDLHLISSAYVCGVAEQPVPEAFAASPPAFHNDYERSKWEAERLCHAWSASDGNVLTVYRPSIVVGDRATGRATKFDGFYLAARGAEALGRLFDPSDPRRHALPLRLRGRADDRQNIVPVDYVAGLIAAGVRRLDMRGRMYHIVHPTPPTNAQMTDACNRQFDIRGGHWIEPAEFDAAEPNTYERLFLRISRPIRHYFSETPTFLRHHARALEAAAADTLREYDEPSLQRLLAFAQQAAFARQPAPGFRTRDAQLCAAYFEEFLPSRVPRSKIASITGLSTIIRFDIKDVADGQWVCRFSRGSLAEVHRGPNTLHEAFGYRLTREVFLRAVAGDIHPQHAFLSGEIDIFGDVEQALKMAMILHAFNQEFPFRTGALPCK